MSHIIPIGIMCDMNKGQKLTYKRKRHGRKCGACERMFPAIRTDAKTCSPRCRQWLARFVKSHGRYPMFEVVPYERPKFHKHFDPQWRKQNGWPHSE